MTGRRKGAEKLRLVFQLNVRALRQKQRGAYASKKNAITKENPKTAKSSFTATSMLRFKTYLVRLLQENVLEIVLQNPDGAVAAA